MTSFFMQFEKRRRGLLWEAFSSEGEGSKGYKCGGGGGGKGRVGPGNTSLLLSSHIFYSMSSQRSSQGSKLDLSLSRIGEYCVNHGHI